MLNILFVAVCILLGGTALLALHWFPWPKRLSRVQCYLIGGAFLVGVPAAIALAFNAMGVIVPGAMYALITITNAVVDGVCVIGAYWIDAQDWATHREDARNMLQNVEERIARHWRRRQRAHPLGLQDVEGGAVERGVVADGPKGSL